MLANDKLPDPTPTEPSVLDPGVTVDPDTLDHEQEPS